MNGMETGEYKIARYEISREHGSAYDAWVQMGAPANVDEYGRQYLERMSYPAYHTEEIFCDGELNITEKIEPHEVLVITIKKMG